MQTFWMQQCFSRTNQIRGKSHFVWCVGNISCTNVVTAEDLLLTRHNFYGGFRKF